MRCFLVALLAGFAFVANAQESKPADAGAVSFTRQVAPLLVKHCQACHGPRDPKGGYQLHTFESLQKPGDGGGAPVTAAKLDESEIYRLITESDKSQRMPKDGEPLPAEAIALVKRWIEEGAKFDSPDPQAMLSSIVPKPVHPAAPEKYRVPMPVTALAFHPSGKELAVGGYHEITIWSADDGKLLRHIGNVAQRTYGLQYSQDGSLLAAASGTPAQLGEVKLFNPENGALVKDLATTADVAFEVAFNPAGGKLAACAADRSIRIFDVASGQQERLIEDHADWVMGVAWNSDGTRLASASRDKTAKVFDAKTGDSLVTYPGHGDTVYGVCFSADGKLVLSCGADRKIHLWNPADAKKDNEIGGFGNEVYKVSVQAGRILACSADKTGRMFDAEKRSQLRAFNGHQDWVYSQAYHDGTKRLATGSYDGEVRIWNAEDGAAVATFKAAPGYAASK